MITKNNIEMWALLMYELDDAKEHLENMIKGMTEDDEFDEVDFKIELGHVYAHLNRAWNSRDIENEDNKCGWEELSAFPKDIEPVG